MYTRLILLFLLSILSIFLYGCTNENIDDSALPWATPSEWEGRLPGIGAGSSM